MQANVFPTYQINARTIKFIIAQSSEPRGNRKSIKLMKSKFLFSKKKMFSFFKKNMETFSSICYFYFVSQGNISPETDTKYKLNIYSGYDGSLTRENIIDSKLAVRKTKNTSTKP